MKNKLKMFGMFLLGILLFSGIGLAHTGSDDYSHHCGMMGSWGGMMSGSYGMGYGLFGWIIFLLVVVALVLLIVWLIKRIQKE